MYSNIETYKWVRLGGIYEDSRPVPVIYSRSLQHFHDPTKPLDEAGYKGSWMGISKEWDSSIIWALSENGQSSLNLGDYSWGAVREYFYNALTSTDPDDREKMFAETFRGVGQLMHLVEDASVPLHTRNNGHPFGFHYEEWVTGIQNNAEFTDMISNPPDAYSAMLGQPGMQEFGGNPISRLFDTDAYNGYNPGVTANGNAGLAEYSNANFFTRETATAYEYPANAAMTESLKLVPDPENPGEYICRNYYSKEGDGAPVEYLASVSYVKRKFDKYYLQEFYEVYIFMDEACYRDYASRLLPKAAGYSAALMKYFFRGDIDAKKATPVHSEDGEVTGVTLRVVNNTPGEDMSDGALTVSYSYTLDGDEVFGASSEYALTAPVPPGNEPVETYEYSFEFGDPIPSDAEDIKYTLVYKGGLGLEDDAVAARAFTAGNTVIEDWESGREWTSMDMRITLGVAAPGNDNSTGALKLYVDSGSASFAVFTSDSKPYSAATLVANGHYYMVGGSIETAYWDSYNGLYNLTYKKGQRLLSPGEHILDYIKSDFGWAASMDRGDNITGIPYSFTFDVRAEIYEDTGVESLPGSLIATSETKTITGLSTLSGRNAETSGDINAVTLSFPGGVKLQDGISYNFLYSAFSPTCSREPALNDFGYSFIGVKIRDKDVVQGNFFCYVDGWGVWLDFPNSDITATSIYVRDDVPIAQCSIPSDCSDKNNLKLAVKSAMTGNMVDLVYGTDEDHAVSVPLNSTSTDWEIIETEISDSVDKSKLSYFAIKFGKDAFDSDGKTKENTIYIDDLIAE